jgi:nucleotide-binding universal stress UspA family protein
MSGILVGIDGSSHSGRALEWAAREAAVRNVPLTVLAVRQDVIGYSGYAYGYLDERQLADQACLAAQEQTDKVLAQLDDASRPPSVTVRGATGWPGDVLVKAADHADMIVVGARGETGIGKLLLGPVALQVTRHARCPVVVVPAKT